MADTLTIDQKVELAQKISAIPAEDLDMYAHEQNLALHDITVWSTAYEVGGKLGVQAMTVLWRPERLKGRDWHERIKNAAKTFRPRRLRVRAEGNQYTAEEVKPLTVKNIVYTPVFQLRVVVDDDAVEHWFLYWRRADGTWWPHASQGEYASPEDAVAEVRADPHGCFRLHPLH